uniref:Uncharacterized protein n=1 Tax=Rhizophora mucronata TaxID=61149 RepID=A0A2P2NKE4_RHIMU
MLQYIGFSQLHQVDKLSFCIETIHS